MPTQIVVVKRSRRRAFVMLRTAPAWLRAVLAVARSIGRDRSRIEFEAIRASSIGSGGSGVLASERLSGVLWPGPVARADLEGCADCCLCVAACPCQALLLEFSGPAAPGSEVPIPDAPLREIRFDLDPGRCIGCGECVRVCPSNLLEMQVRESRVGEGACPPSRSLVKRPALSGERT